MTGFAIPRQSSPTASRFYRSLPHRSVPRPLTLPIRSPIPSLRGKPARFAHRHLGSPGAGKSLNSKGQKQDPERKP
ncbi:hypothetical protein HYQ46_007719 [Verticillium longisporum]|nr:hypothetical protein HYQ46_007719 [Verticillium longisporum]